MVVSNHTYREVSSAKETKRQDDICSDTLKFSYSNKVEYLASVFFVIQRSSHVHSCVYVGSSPGLPISVVPQQRRISQPVSNRFIGSFGMWLYCVFI